VLVVTWLCVLPWVVQLWRVEWLVVLFSSLFLGESMLSLLLWARLLHHVSSGLLKLHQVCPQQMLS
jgi:hypothetical protein